MISGSVIIYFTIGVSRKHAKAPSQNFIAEELSAFASLREIENGYFEGAGGLVITFFSLISKIP